MSLSDIIGPELAKKLSVLSLEDLRALAQAGSLGFGPAKLHDGIAKINQGMVVDIPTGLGVASPLVIKAWSFVHDKGQYSDTYGLSTAAAADLRDLLRTDRDRGVEQITTIVSSHPRNRASGRAIVVSVDGVPGATAREGAKAAPARVRRGALADIIKANGALYGTYQFTAEDTGRPEGHAYRVRLGGGLYTVAASKREAVAAAQICRVKGRHDPAIASYVAFWRENGTPRFGVDIPAKITFDGRLGVNDPLPADPVNKGETVVGEMR